MVDFNGFKGRAKKIDDVDLPRIGHMIGVGEDKIHAVLDVESAGSGFDKQSRPKMLFEPHIFHREVGAAKRGQAIQSGLAYAKWKPGAYPADSFPRLAKAIAIDETAALRSASWGLGQVMGFNHKLAGFATPQEMVLAMMDDEDKHLEAMIAFIKNRRLADDLARGDWSGFARGYNGAGFAKHGYHTKLANAYARWQKIPDTPFDPVAVAAAWDADDTPMFDDDPAEPDVIPAVRPDPGLTIETAPEAPQRPAERPIESVDDEADDLLPAPQPTRSGSGKGLLAFLVLIAIGIAVVAWLKS